MFGTGEAATSQFIGVFWCVCCSSIELYYVVFFTNISISVLFHHDNYSCWYVYVHVAVRFEPRI